MRKTIIIAEPGATHEGDLGKMRALVQMASECGVDGVKFQWLSDPEALCRRRNAPEYLPHYMHLRFPARWHELLAEECDKRGLLYGCTVYLPEDVAVIEPHVDFFKVAAFEASARDLIASTVAAMTGDARKLVVSLGLGALVQDVMVAMDGLKDIDRLVLLRCISAYPTPFNELHLVTLRSGMNGFSDHTPADDPHTLLVGALATAAGATWIERHVRLEDCRRSNPDYTVSLSAHGLTNYVNGVRFAETVLGSPNVTGAMPSEKQMLRYRAIT